MPKFLALIILSTESPPTSIAKQLEARDFAVHLSRTVDEAERVFTAFPTDQIKFVFADISLCHGARWDELLARIRTFPAEIALVCYHPNYARPLYSLLGHSVDSVGDGKSPIP